VRITAQLLVACAGCLALAAPAAASPLVVVGAHGERTVEDPYLPPPAASDLPPPPPAAARGPRAGSARTLTVRRRLRDLLRAGAITQEAHDRYRALYDEARALRGRLRGARRAELARVISTLERITADRGLTTTRLEPLFLTLERNSDFWRTRPFPRAGARIAFGDDPVIFQYYPGEGIQIQPLANFGKANQLYNACVGENTRPGTPCRRGALRELLDRLVTLAARRGDGIAWEYYFHFGGGSPPWTSGLSQGTAIQALARGAELLSEPSYLAVAADALDVFERRPPVGVRVRMGDGDWYLIYSFNRRLLVLNGFLQAVIGLHDYAQASGNPRAQALFEAGDRLARREVPRFDTGAWSLYSRGGAESTLGYHRLVRDFLEGLCQRTGADVYCERAARFTRYLYEHPRIDLLGVRGRARVRRPARVRFRLSKISRVSLQISRGGRLVFQRRVVNVPYGVHSFTWVPPASGRYRVRLEAADLRNHHTVRRGHLTVRRR
jgi:hypothetical protein